MLHAQVIVGAAAAAHSPYLASVCCCCAIATVVQLLQLQTAAIWSHRFRIQQQKLTIFTASTSCALANRFYAFKEITKKQGKKTRNITKSIFIYFKLFCISLYFFFFVLNDTWFAVVAAVAVVVISFSAILAVATNCNCSSPHPLSPQPLDNPCSTASTRLLCYVLHDNKNVCQMARTTFTQCRQGGLLLPIPLLQLQVRLGSLRLGSVQFCLLAIWLWGGACCVRLCCHCCCCHRL